MKSKITHIQAVGHGKNLTLVPFYEFNPTADEADDSREEIASRPSRLSLDLSTGIALLAFRNFLPACTQDFQNSNPSN